MPSLLLLCVCVCVCVCVVCVCLVLLVCVSFLEDKFAVASGAKAVSVCYFEEDNDWWISKHIKNHDSTVVSVAWHPNNVLLATGSTDRFIRVFSAFVKGVDTRPGETPFGARLPWNGKPLGTWESYGWVQCVAWSPSGFQLAYVAHDSTIVVIDLNNGADQAYQQIVKLSGLPFQKFLWLTESSLVGVGHSCNPTLFSMDSAGAWAQTKLMDEAKKAAAASSGGARSAFNRFKSMDTKAQTASSVELNTKHQNCIT
jgi:actin related protein 2/3 complex, subunit 1A/1B